MNDKKKSALIAGFAAVIIAMSLVVGCCDQKEDTRLNDAITLATQGDQAMIKLDWITYAPMIYPEDMDKFKSMLLLELERLAMSRKSDSVTVFDQTFSLEELRQEPAEKFFSDIMVILFRVSPELNRSFTNMKNTFIGAVAENDSTIHVVAHTRMMVGTRHVDEMNVVTVHRVEDGWKLGISSKLQGVGYMLVESLQMQR